MGIAGKLKWRSESIWNSSLVLMNEKKEVLARYIPACMAWFKEGMIEILHPGKWAGVGR